jgi:hypothetical protein
MAERATLMQSMSRQEMAGGGSQHKTVTLHHVTILFFIRPQYQFLDNGTFLEKLIAAQLLIKNSKVLCSIH